MNVIIVEDDPLVAQLNSQYLSRLEGVAQGGIDKGKRPAGRT